MTVSVREDDGTSVRLVSGVCRPPVDTGAPVVIINHGSPPSTRQRPPEATADCDDEAPSWFLSGGFVVVQVRAAAGRSLTRRATDFVARGKRPIFGG